MNLQQIFCILFVIIKHQIFAQGTIGLSDIDEGSAWLEMDGKVESWLFPFFPLNSKFFIEILSPGSARFFANFKMTVRLQQSQEPLGSDSLPKELTDLSDPSTYVDVETVELVLQAEDQKTEIISATFTVEGVVMDGFVCNAAGTEIMINDTIEIDFVTGMKVDNMTEIKRDDGLDCGFQLQSHSQVGTVLQAGEAYLVRLVVESLSREYTALEIVEELGFNQGKTTPVIDPCTAASKGIVLSEGKKLNITFQLPAESNFTNITKDGKLVIDGLFQQKDNTYFFIKNSVVKEDAGTYVMNHETLGYPASCFSVLLVAVPTNVTKVMFTDTIEAQLVHGNSEFSTIQEMLPDIQKVHDNLYYTVYQGNFGYVEQLYPQQKSTISNIGKMTLQKTSRFLNIDRVKLHYTSSESEIKVFDVSFQLTISSKCTAQMKRCNGEPECDNFSDEMGCSTKGVYSRMALSEGQEIIFPAPSRDHTLCFYTFAAQTVTVIFSADPAGSLRISSQGYYCAVARDSAVSTYMYDASAKTFKETTSKANSTASIQQWILSVTKRNNIKNVIVYNKALSTTEMASYVTKCGQEGYPASTDLYMDHHFLVMLLAKFPATGTDSQIKYVVLSSMCDEIATPSGSVNLATTHLCSSGKAIPFHCLEQGGDQYCGTALAKECEYVNSQIVALADKKIDETCTRSTIENEHNNLLGVKAISSANTFINCPSSDCTTKAYLQDLKKGSKEDWTTKPMTYTNWTADVQISQTANRPVRLNNDGSWGVEDELPEDSKLLCNVGGATGSESTNSRALKFASASDYCQLKVEKTSILNKLTICWAASGSGVLLQYTGLSSISGKDIYIASETIKSRTYLTVYIAGFPEYFEFDSTASGSHMCLRWEKITGRIDLAINGELVVGRNTYASSRKINLPSSGKLVVGAEINRAADKVEKDSGRWSGQINNLVIFNRFFNPLMLVTTSKQSVCIRTKAEAWLSFEDVIAGSTNPSMYSKITCTSQGDGSRKKRDSGSGTVTKHTISINYSLYSTSTTSDITKWATSTETGVTVSMDSTSKYSVGQLNGKGNVRLNPLSSLCFSGSSLSDTSGYIVKVFAHSTGLTTLQIGQETITVSKGSPFGAATDVVYPVGNKICITNVLSPSDYAPLDGYIESIQYWKADAAELSCPSETEDLQDKGQVVWPATLKAGLVSVTCPYGKDGDYTKIALVTRECGGTGWVAGTTDSSNCATKYKIDASEATKYFDETTISNENVDEYANTINQVVQEEEEVTLETMTTAADALDKLSESDDVTITDTTMTTVVEVANTINLNSDVQADKEAEAKTATKIVESVANLAAKVEIKENEQFVSKTQSVSVAAFKPPPVSSSTDGEEKIAGDITASFQEGDDGTNIDISTDSTETDTSSKSVIKIRRDQVDAGKNVWFTSYQGNSTLFISDTKFDLDGQIIGAGIGEESKDFDEGKGVMMTFFTNATVSDKNALCQYWDMTDGVGAWSSKGMKFINKTDKSITCQSSHLTNFAILINPSNTIFDGAEQLTLQIITIVGCTLSIIGLLATIIGLAVFKQIRSVLTNRVHIGLSTSLLFAYIFLLIGPDLVEEEGVCYFFSILIHFCFLCAFCWMLCEAINLYLRLVVVFDSYSKMFLKFSAFSIVTPVVIVLITVIVEFAGDNGAYIISNEASGIRVACWLDYKARMAAFLLPLLLILCANFVVFIMVMRVLFASKKSATASNKTHWLARLRSAVAVSTLIGLSWILGFFALGEASFAINVIFSLCNSLQGVLICYLYCFAKTDVMTKWRSTIQSSFGKSKDTSGLSTSNSGAPRPHTRFNTGAKTTKTTSLALSSKGTSVSVPGADKNGKYNNVYSNEASISLNEVKEVTVEATYSDIPQSDHDVDEDHIYEDLNPSAPVMRRAGGSDPAEDEEEEKRRTITLSRTLQSRVKEKVETYEGIIQGAEVVVTCPVDGSKEAKTCPDPSDPSTSFQIKSGSGVSGDSKSPFDL